MIHAFDEKYLDDAMRNLGEAFDFARNVCQVELDDFFAMMISSGAAAQFERGNPQYVSGLSGTELVLEVLRKSGIPQEDAEPQTEYSCSQEHRARLEKECFEILSDHFTLARPEFGP